MAYEQNLLMIVIFIIVGILASQATSRTLYKASITEKYEQWMAEHGRIYPDGEEKERRFDIFKKNVEFVEKFNNLGNTTYTLGVNEFSDMTNEEFLRHRSGYKKPTGSSSTSLSEDTSSIDQCTPNLNTHDIPAAISIDWRALGAVTPIKNQSGCGACWVFAAVAAVEGITAIKTGKLISLSEQQILDCSDDLANKNGCTYGDVEAAFQYIKKNGGIASEMNYPYLSIDHQTCNADKTTEYPAQITGCEKVPNDRYDLLLKAVSVQPVSVLIDNRGDAFRFYHSGVFTGPCTDDVNHAVTIVGYGTSEDGVDYWLLKNSWGVGWGDQGYMKISRSTTEEGSSSVNGHTTETLSKGICGLLQYAYYPTA